MTDFTEIYKREIAHIKLNKEQIAQLLIGQELIGFRTRITMEVTDE